MKISTIFITDIDGGVVGDLDFKKAKIIPRKTENSHHVGLDQLCSLFASIELCNIQ